MAKNRETANAGRGRFRQPSRLTLALTLAAVVVALGAAVAFSLKIIPEHFDGFSGGRSLYVERVELRDHPLVLNESDARVRVPELARLLDGATRAGEASTSDRGEIDRILAYLDAEAERAVDSISSSPRYGGPVEWRGVHFEFAVASA